MNENLMTVIHSIPRDFYFITLFILLFLVFKIKKL